MAARSNAVLENREADRLGVCRRLSRTNYEPHYSLLVVVVLGIWVLPVHALPVHALPVHGTRYVHSRGSGWAERTRADFAVCARGVR